VNGWGLGPGECAYTAVCLFSWENDTPESKCVVSKLNLKVV